MRGFAKRPPELQAEMRTGQTSRTSQIPHRQRLEVPRVNQVLGPHQMTYGRNRCHAASIAIKQHPHHRCQSEPAEDHDLEYWPP